MRAAIHESFRSIDHLPHLRKVTSGGEYLMSTALRDNKTHSCAMTAGAPLPLVKYAPLPHNVEFNSDHAYALGTALAEDWNAQHRGNRFALPHMVARFQTNRRDPDGTFTKALLSGFFLKAAIEATSPVAQSYVWRSARRLGVGAVVATTLGGTFSGLLGFGVGVGAATALLGAAVFGVRHEMRRMSERTAFNAAQIAEGARFLLIVDQHPLLCVARVPSAAGDPTASIVTSLTVDPAHEHSSAVELLVRDDDELQAWPLHRQALPQFDPAAADPMLPYAEIGM